MSSSNCCFLTCIQISQETGQVVWYSHLFQNFPQFVVIHTDKDFGSQWSRSKIFFWNSLAFSMIQQMLAVWPLVPLPFLNSAWTFGSNKRRIYTWTSPDGQNWNQIDYILCSQRWRSSIQSVKTRPEADCGSDHELLITKFRLKLKKVGKTTRPFRYDLNQIPYDYIVEVRNRFKGLDR